LEFHSCPAFNFIACLALFNWNFIHAQPSISLLAWPYLIGISFMPSLQFHFLPGLISSEFHSCPAFNFIACPALFQPNFNPAWPLILLPFLLHSHEDYIS